MPDLDEGDGPYNPLAERNLARGVAEALERRPVRHLPPALFAGPGIYALYYVGECPLYLELARLTRAGAGAESLDVGPHAVPIYVGKASSGQGRHGKLSGARARPLHERIKKHSRSIAAAVSTLAVTDFRVRYLCVSDIWVPLGEQGLLQRFTPIWNVVLAGFGNNPVGRGRAHQARSPWDMLHPGRPGTGELRPNAEPIEEIRWRVSEAVHAIVQHRPIPEGVLSDEDQNGPAD